MNLKDLIANILSKFEGGLYNATLTKLVYLVDIKAVYETGNQLTDIDWVRYNYGPFVWDVIDCAESNPKIFKIEIENGGPKRKISLRNAAIPRIDAMTERLIENVLRDIPNPQTNLGAFKDYVYETPPMVISTGNGLLEIKQAMTAAKEVDDLAAMLDTPEWNESFEYLASH